MAGFTLKTQVLAMMDKGRSHAQHRLSRSLSTTALGIASRVQAWLFFADKANDIFKQSQQCLQGPISRRRHNQDPIQQVSMAKPTRATYNAIECFCKSKISRSNNIQFVFICRHISSHR